MQNNPRILIVDDEESIRFTFESFLTDEGYVVETARNYDEALARIDQSVFDLIFADVILGGRTGIDVTREIKKRYPSCPVIIITGDPNIESAAEAVRLGAFDYIPKPVRQETLIRQARMALKHKEIHEEKEKYRSNLEAIFRSVKDAIITVDKDLKVVEINEAAGKICGLCRDAKGKMFGSLTADCTGQCLDALVKTIKDNQPVEVYRHECFRNNRSGRVVSLSTSPLLDGQGAFSGAVIIIRDETRLADLERDLGERHKFHNIIGRSGKMRDVYSLMENLADVQTTVLVTGESGTGKELIAEALHYSGVRSTKSLVKVNCSALSESLLESELFGHVKGAFTGAVKDKVGRFQRADGGTIFLDEIGDISMRTQLRLLRVLQEMEFEKVGDSTPVKADVRIIAATNQDLYSKVKLGGFREDLYYRLKVVEITLPPLRDRLEDVPSLIDHFLEKFNSKLKRDVRAISEDVQKIFMRYPWPGNIRELEHALEHAFILCRQNTILVEHLPVYLREPASTKPAFGNDSQDESLEILQALRKTAGNKARAARLLGLDRKTLYRKIEKYKIEEYKDP